MLTFTKNYEQGGIAIMKKPKKKKKKKINNKKKKNKNKRRTPLDLHLFSSIWFS